tara:strand:+ start:1610 stop:2038 length:429 start_codon:yes stop_codon:yes gene_type:complete
MEKVRIDKWLWTVRIFKSRSIATQACKSGKIKVSGSKCKPARMVLVNDLISVDKKGLKLEFKILELLKSRVGFSIAKDCYEDLTSLEEREKFRAFHHRRLSGEDRDIGLGRPTKRDRRELENFKEIDEWMDEDLSYDLGDED